MLARYEQWTQFDRDWSTVLAKYGVNWFHSKHFGRNVRHGRGDFAGWDEARRTSFFDRLIQIINENVLFLSGSLTRFSSPRDRDSLRAEYLAAHRYTVLQSVAFARERIDFIFARHSEINPIQHHLLLREWLIRSDPHYAKIGDLTLADPRKNAPLQAADLIAREVHSWDQKNPRLPAIIRVPFVSRAYK